MIEMGIYVALVIGLTQVTKITLGLKSKYVPLCALILSLILVGIYTLISRTPLVWTMLETAIVVALTSVGLWSGVKNSIIK